MAPGARWRAEQPQALQLGLHHQQTIEDEVFRAAVGVAVDPGQVLHRQRVLGADREFAESLPQQAQAQGGGLHLEVGPAQGRFDRHLPQAHDAEHQRLGRIRQQARRPGRQPAWFDRPPEQQLGVDQQGLGFAGGHGGQINRTGRRSRRRNQP